MKAFLGIISVVLYFLVGIVCLIMAYTTLRAKKFLPFHEEAVGKKWDELESGMQETILVLTHLSGLGFLIIGLLLTVISILGYIHTNTLVRFVVPILSLIFCVELFQFNYQLYKRTNANTPWQSSLVALVIILIAFGLSLFSL